MTDMSWINVPKNHPFPIQNLPFGVFSSHSRNHSVRRIGVAIGDYVLDLKAIHYAGLLDDLDFDARVFTASTLNAYMALNKSSWRATRARITNLLSMKSTDRRLRDDHILQQESIFPASEIEMHLPADIGDYTDFYSSKEHATNVGIMFRGVENALQPNWLHLPVGYHGRASSVVISGTDVTRPHGQLQKTAANPTAGSSFGPSKQLDFELEMAYFVGGMANPLGQPITMEEAEDRIFGVVLMNDWSARDVQAWEYVPLGPFTSKNFCTSISPWVVSLDALEPFKCVPSAGPIQQPTPLPYILDPHYGLSGFDVKLQVSIQPECSSHPSIVSCSNMKNLYWNSKQQLVHHSITGCPMKAGDLLGTGTISGPTDSSMGSMLELSWRGTREVPLDVITLEDSKEILDLDNPWILRKFIEDGDTVTMTGYAEFILHESESLEDEVKVKELKEMEGGGGNLNASACEVKEGYRIGFGKVTGKVIRALPLEYFTGNSTAISSTSSAHATTGIATVAAPHTNPAVDETNQIHDIKTSNGAISHVSVASLPLPPSPNVRSSDVVNKLQELRKPLTHVYTDFKLFSYWRSTCSWRYEKKSSPTDEDITSVTNATFGVIVPISNTLSSPLNQVPVLEFKSNNTPATARVDIVDVNNIGDERIDVCNVTNHTLTQSLAIIEFLDNLYPLGTKQDQYPLLPQDPLLCAKVRQIANIVNSGIQPLQSINILRLVHEVDVNGERGNGTLFAKSKTEEGLNAIEGLLAEIRTETVKKQNNKNENNNNNKNDNKTQIQIQTAFQLSLNSLFAVGTDYPTLADLCIIPQIYNARYRLHIPINDVTHPHLSAVDRLCNSLKAFQLAAPDMQPDAVVVL